MRDNIFKPTKFLLKRYLYLAIITFIVVFLAVPFWGYNHISTDLNVANYDYPANFRESQANALIADSFYGNGNLETATFTFVIIGFVSALILFSHLFNRKQTMLNATLPISPTQDYFHRAICFAALVLLPSLVALMFLPLHVWVTGFSIYCDVGLMMAKIGILLLIEVYGFVLGTLSCALTGQLWAAVVGGVVLGFSLDTIILCIQNFFECYMITNPFDPDELYQGIFQHSPLYPLYKNFYLPGSIPLWPALLCIALCLAATVYLYRIRPAERAAQPLTFPFSEYVLTPYLALLCGLLFASINSVALGNEILTIVMGLLGIAVGWLLCELLFTLRLRAIFRRVRLIAVPAALLLFMFSVFHFDLFGYDSFLPDREAVSAISINPQRYSDSYNALTFSQPDTLDAAYDFVTDMQQETLKKRAFYQGYTREVIVTYHVNGKEIVRAYDLLNGPDQQPAIRTLLGSEEYKNAILYSPTMNLFRQHLRQDNASIHVNLRTPINDTAYMHNLGLYSEDFSSLVYPKQEYVSKLLEAFSLDIANCTASDLQLPRIGYISFSFTDLGHYYYLSYDITAAFVHTLEAMLGDKKDAVLDYIQGGCLESPNYVVCRVSPQEDQSALVQRVQDPQELRRIASEYFSASNTFTPPLNFHDTCYCVFMQAQFDHLKADCAPDSPADSFQVPSLETAHDYAGITFFPLVQ